MSRGSSACRGLVCSSRWVPQEMLSASVSRGWRGLLGQGLRGAGRAGPGQRPLVTRWRQGGEVPSGAAPGSQAAGAAEAGEGPRTTGLGAKGTLSRPLGARRQGAWGSSPAPGRPGQPRGGGHRHPDPARPGVTPEGPAESRGRCRPRARDRGEAERRLLPAAQTAKDPTPPRSLAPFSFVSARPRVTHVGGAGSALPGNRRQAAAPEAGLGRGCDTSAWATGRGLATCGVVSGPGAEWLVPGKGEQGGRQEAA